ncbi:MAG: CBS and ACT domain-containing protein [Candidatus Methylomirabilia bacterium]
MFVADWMTRQVVTVGPDESVARAMHLMKEKGIKHLPVMGDGRLVGVISDRDINAYAPSKATSLDVFEINYLLAKAKVKDAMGAHLTTTTPETPVEAAALVMLDNNIGCLPVLEGGALVGIISDRDIFRSLVDISGVRHGGHRISLTVEDRPGTIREVTDLVRSSGFHLQGILSSYEGVAKGSRRVVVRTTKEGDFEALRGALEAACRDVRITKG